MRRINYVLFLAAISMAMMATAYGAVEDDACIHYSFDGGDLTNLANPGTLDLTGGDIGTVIFDTGISGDAVYFDGAAQRLNASGYDDSRTMARNTTSFWIKVNPGSAGKKVFEEYKSWLIYYAMRDGGNGYAIKAQWLEDAGWSVKNMWYSDDPQMLYTNAIPTVVPTGVWNMITFSASTIASGGTGQMKLYCNGVLIQTSPDDHPGFETDPAHIAVLDGRNISSNPATPILGSDVAGENSLDGGLDEFYIWDRCLSDTEVMQHYNSFDTDPDTDPEPDPDITLVDIDLIDTTITITWEVADTEHYTVYRSSSMNNPTWTAVDEGPISGSTVIYTASDTANKAFYKLSIGMQPWQWSSVGPGAGGMSMAFAADPVDTNTFYFGSDVSGVFKSTDGGTTWQCKNSGQEDMYITEIMIKPDATNVVFASCKGGLYKSTNGGESWTLKRSGFPPIASYSYSAPVCSLAIDPLNTNTIYAGMDSGGKIYKSIDIGENWFLVNTPGSPISASSSVRSIVCSLNTSGTLYATNEQGVYKSSDGGVTWTAKNSGLPHTQTMELAINPIANPDELYMTIYTPEGSWNGGVYKSSNGADSWTAKNTGLDKATGSGLYASQYRAIVIDPKTPSTLYVGNASWSSTGGAYKSTNGGDLWTKITSSSTVDNAIWNLHITSTGSYSVRILGISPVDPNILIFGTEFEVYKTADGGASWTSAYTDEIGVDTWKEKGEFDLLCATSTAVDPTDPNKVYIGYGDVQLLRSTDGCTSFSWAGYGINPGNLMHPYNWVHSVVVDPDTTTILYAGAGARLNYSEGGALYKSVNYGQSWIQLAGGASSAGGLPDSKPRSIAIDTTSSIYSRTIYTVVHNYGIYKSTDGGSNWSAINSGISTPSKAEGIFMDPNDASTLYAAVENYGLYKSIDAGSSWTKLSLPGNPGVRCVAIDSSNSNIIYTGGVDNGNSSNGGIYKSTDAGASWVHVYNGVHAPCDVRALVVDPDDSNIIYAGLNDNPFHDKCQSEGFLISKDGGATWTAHNEGLYVRNIRSITVVKGSANGPLIYVGTHGNGAFKVGQ
jgi:photosystem II stability/assembly factor-like uncharacterized protein